MEGAAAQQATTEAAQQRARVRGIVLMCAANVLFCSTDAVAKILVTNMSSMQVAWARFIGAFVITLALANVVLQPHRMRATRPGLQLLRGFLLLLCNVLMLTALRYLQLDQTSTIMFVSPFLVAALAVPLLGERIGPRRWAAIAIGFCGVLLVMRPGLGGIHPAAFLCLACALSYAFYSILTRVLSHTDSSSTTLFYTNLVGAVALSAAVPFFWTTPTLRDGVLMAVMSTAAVLGHYLLIAAHRLAPASILSPFMYTQLVWMILYGYLLFNDLPNHWTLAGASLAIASGLYLLYRERKVKGEAAPVSADPVA
jgi:drug/metabolite transporter (DMT)-like permease